MVGADPITYDFTGMMYDLEVGSRDPYVGPVSGSFTFNTNPTNMTGTPYPVVFETGGDVSVTLNVGGQVFHFVNPPQDPFSVDLSVFHTVPTTPSSAIDFEIIGYTGGVDYPTPTNDRVNISLSPGSATLPANLADLPLTADLSAISFTSPWGEASGSLTSLEPVNAPEPGTLAIFATLGLATVLWCHRRSP
jgi:hypothetical protein